jgi:hypothetical protein
MLILKNHLCEINLQITDKATNKALHRTPHAVALFAKNTQKVTPTCSAHERGVMQEKYEN